MKKIICLFSIVGFITLGSCDNSNRGIQNNEKADNDLMDQRDTSSINEEFNPRGVPEEGLPGNNGLRNDTMGVGDNNTQMMGDLPEAVSQKLMQEPTFKQKKLTNTRKYSDGGRTYYEFTFDNEQDKVVYDEEGNSTTTP